MRQTAVCSRANYSQLRIERRYNGLALGLGSFYYLEVASRLYRSGHNGLGYARIGFVFE